MSKIGKYLKSPKKVFSYLNQKFFNRLVPDALYVKSRYKKITGKKLNLKNPQSFNEKLQWLKLYDRNPIYSKMVDKYEAKKYVADIIGEEYIIPTLGVWDKFSDIDFDALPNQFVLKCTHDSGGLVICRDKRKLDKEKARKKINRSLKRNYYWGNREWPYKNVKHRIIAEDYLENIAGQGLIDYKFYCFNGEPKYLYVSQGLENHATASISFLTLDWQFAPFRRNDYKPLEVLPEKPKNFDKMIELAKVLSKDVPFLRVDLYEVDGKIYFSELTFSPCSGMMPFNPPEWDLKLGEYITLPSKEK